MFSWRGDPLAASSDGIHAFDDRLPTVTPAAQERRLKGNRQFLRRLRAIERRRLSAGQQVSYDLFDFMVSQRVTLGRYKEWRLPMSSDSGFYSEVLYMDELADPRTVAEYENFIARLSDVPRYFDENIANMRDGAREGFTLPAAILGGVSEVIASAQFDDAEKMPLWRPFARFSHAVPEPQRARLATAGKAALTGAVIPAYRAFRRFFETEYKKSARRTIGASALPQGREYYADLVRYFTTLPDATPEGIHETGKAEVARIRGEMDAILRKRSGDAPRQQSQRYHAGPRHHSLGNSRPIDRYRSGSSPQPSRTLTNRNRCTFFSRISVSSRRAASPIALID